MSKVMIQPASYEDLRRAVDRAFALFSSDMAGKRVLIKPNVLRSARPEEGITTHPALLGAVVERVATAQPEALVVGDNPGVHGYGTNRACFEKTGLLATAGAHYKNIGNDPVQVPFNRDFMKNVPVSREVLEADIIISLPKFKTHGLTVVSGAIKNSYGILPGAVKARLHKAAGSRQRFQELMVDVFALRIPDLIIVDAVVGMEGNGPASPELRDIGCILAGGNAVAVDSVIVQMMGLDPGRLRFLQYAKEKGLGDFAPESIETEGKIAAIPEFRLPPLDGAAIVQDPSEPDFIAQRLEMRPRVNGDLCSGCGICASQCPVSTLMMDENQTPAADAETCIACFCCQELCPEKAIRLE